MNQIENKIRQTINNHFILSLKKPTKKYLQFDAYDKNYIVEIKARRKYYKTQIIEFSKYAFNSYFSKLHDREFIYAVSINNDLYIFNITKLEQNNYDFNWEWRKQPSTTDFENNDKIMKYVGYLHLKDSSKKIKL